MEFGHIYVHSQASHRVISIALCVQTLEYSTCGCPDTLRIQLFGHVNIFCNTCHHLYVHFHINRQGNLHNLDNTGNNTAPGEDQVDNCKNNDPSRIYLERKILKLHICY